MLKQNTPHAMNANSIIVFRHRRQQLNYVETARFQNFVKCESTVFASAPQNNRFFRQIHVPLQRLSKLTLDNNSYCSTSITGQKSDFLAVPSDQNSMLLGGGGLFPPVFEISRIIGTRIKPAAKQRNGDVLTLE
jgi:hypothetical protein